MDAIPDWLIPTLIFGLVAVAAVVLIARFVRTPSGPDADPEDEPDLGSASILLLGAGAVGLAIASAALASVGIQKLRSQRDLERVPRTEVVAALTGEINLVGSAEADQASPLPIAPRSGVPSVYYRYTVEKKTTDSEGKTKWETVERQRRWADSFRLVDDSGSIVVEPGRDELFHPGERALSETVGDRRYREWRIEPGDRVFVFGFARVDAAGRGAVGFDEPGRYSPMISRADEQAERASMATGAVFLCWAGLAALSFAVYLGGWLGRLHQTPTYLAILALVIVGGLTYCGLRMIADDLTAARDRLHRARDSARGAVAEVLHSRGIAWDGDWSALGRFDDPSAFPLLDERERRRLTRLRIDLARAVARTNGIRERFPERLLAPAFGVRAEPPIPLPTADAEAIARLDGEFQAARIAPGVAGVVALVAAVMVVIGSWIGLRKIKEKRYIENVPTCPTSGVAVGFTELIGTVERADGQRQLTGPISQKPCAQYHYTVQERRGSGKNAKWVTIEDRNEQVPFLCRDDHGTLLVLPEGAEILTRHHSTRRAGKRQHSETRLEIGDPLYALGTATIEPREMTTLRLERGDERALPYLLSNFSESTIMHRKARVGQFWITLAFNCLALPTLLAFGLAGSFQATDFLAATLVAIGYFALAVAIMLFNDLVFLRNRVRRAWHNIEVSLKKRADLVPNLQAVVQGYLSHEREAQQELAQLRLSYGGGAMLDLTQAAETLTAERSLLDRIVGLREAHPELKADRLTGDLMRRLTLLENEIALMRQGYNDAVERYNTRIAHVPEVLLATLFGFAEASYFDAPVEVQEAPRLELVTDSA